MPALSAVSKQRLAGAHPKLQALFNVVATKTPIMVLDSQRGRAAQEKAFALGNSKAHFGQSAHNWSPAIALDVVPYPVDWNNLQRFRDLAAIVLAEAAKQKTPIVWGGAWKMRDFPHYELGPDWRAWAAKSKPFEG